MMQMKRLVSALLFFGLGAFSITAQAAVIAAVDRANVELNESFTLKITVDTAGFVSAGLGTDILDLTVEDLEVQLNRAAEKASVTAREAIWVDCTTC